MGYLLAHQAVSADRNNRLLLVVESHLTSDPPYYMLCYPDHYSLLHGDKAIEEHKIGNISA